MCGIAGYIGPGELKKLEAMLNRLVHRGPDDEGIYQFGQFHIGMRRLSIVDLEGGRQPMFNRDKSVAVVFNGEIYNAAELRVALEKKGYRFKTNHSDTEVIAHLYDEFGIDFIEKMTGMFAICLVDLKKEELYLIRDRIGKKPIFYKLGENDELLEFASEFDAIGSDRGDLHVSSFAWFFSQKSMPQERTSRELVRKVPPGSYLKAQPGEKIRIIRYYSVKNKASEKKLPEEEACSKLEQLLSEAVRIRMQADVEVGAYLSGGIDSSLTVTFASKFSSHPIKTYSLVYDGEIYNKSSDRKFARQISEKLKTEHHEVLLTPGLFIENVPRAIKHFGEPYAGSIANWFISRAMQKHIKVAISGDGADEIFGSYLLHRVAAGVRDHAKNLNVREQKLVDLGLKDSFDHVIDTFAIFTSTEQKKLFNPSMMEKMNAGADLKRKWEQTEPTADTLNRMLEFECKNTLVELILSYVDNLSMAHSIEVRVPFLDHRIVDFAFSLDSHLKINKGETKYLLKRLAERYLPKEQIYRPKEGFIEPAVFWLKDELKEFCYSHLKSSGFNKHGLLNGSYVHELLEKYYNTFDFDLGKKVWTLVMFAVWEKECSDS